MNSISNLVNAHSVLVIIDMQTGFDTAHEPYTIAACQKMIELFKEKQLTIIFLRYGVENISKTEKYSHGRILPALTKLVKDYRFSKTLTKRGNSGAEMLEKYLKNHELRLFLCGVNASSCVLDTANGLLARNYKDLVVIKAACNDEEGTDIHGNTSHYSWEGFKSLGIKVI